MNGVNGSKSILQPHIKKLDEAEKGLGDQIKETNEENEDDNMESPPLEELVDKTQASGAKNSAAETKADEMDVDEESKLSTNPDEEVEATFLNTEVEGFKMDFIHKTQGKSDSEMRRKFLCKLTQEKIWLTPSEKPKTHQTCIIFDWDDTLLCTTFLNPSN